MNRRGPDPISQKPRGIAIAGFITDRLQMDQLRRLTQLVDPARDDHIGGCRSYIVT